MLKHGDAGDQASLITLDLRACSLPSRRPTRASESASEIAFDPAVAMVAGAGLECWALRGTATGAELVDFGAPAAG